LTASERKLGHEIVNILARDVEESVRASLARGLRHAQNLPRDIARKLADDVELVAGPLLADSLVLTDEDLIEIVLQGSNNKQEVIANRPNLTELVCDALITHAREPAVAVLMGNETAAIADGSFDRAVTRFADSDRVKEAMVMRRVLPPVVAERLVTIVSKALQAHLVSAHDLAPETVADIVMVSRETAIIRLSLGASDDDLLKMTTAMHVNGRLTPTLIMRALYAGDMAFFEAAMAARSEIPLSNARILIHDSSRQGLEALYKRASMPAAAVGVVRAAVEVADETNFDGAEQNLERFRSRVITRVLMMAEKTNSDHAAPMLDKLWEVLINGKSVSVD
jgi:uncharacterized protein (DUF2336 family)